MVTVAAATIAGAAQQAIKRTSSIVVIGEYPIIELRIRVAMFPLQMHFGWLAVVRINNGAYI